LLAALGAGPVAPVATAAKSGGGDEAPPVLRVVIEPVPQGPSKTASAAALSGGSDQPQQAVALVGPDPAMHRLANWLTDLLRGLYNWLRITTVSSTTTSPADDLSFDPVDRLRTAAHGQDSSAGQEGVTTSAPFSLAALAAGLFRARDIKRRRRPLDRRWS
jgi:hypothetical protein